MCSVVFVQTSANQAYNVLQRAAAICIACLGGIDTANTAPRIPFVQLATTWLHVQLRVQLA
jgi:hypothetical protein